MLTVACCRVNTVLKGYGGGVGEGHVLRLPMAGGGDRENRLVAAIQGPEKEGLVGVWLESNFKVSAVK